MEFDMKKKERALCLGYFSKETNPPVSASIAGSEIR
jgi:hypothetical protein